MSLLCFLGGVCVGTVLSCLYFGAYESGRSAERLDRLKDEGW